MDKIKISDVKSFREQLDATHLIVLAIDADNMYHVASHGKSEKDAIESADIANNLKQLLGFDKSLCNSKPVERKCSNCSFYTPDYNGWSKDSDIGYCNFSPFHKVSKCGNDKCGYFEPKN